MNNNLYYFEKTKRGLVLTGYAQNYYFEEGHISELTLPAEYNGTPVVEIGKDAFTCAWALHKITIPEGIRRIADYSFAHCKNLRSVSFPETLESIGAYAFHYCVELCEAEFKSSPSIGEFAFRYDYKLPAETILAGQVGSFDLTRPLSSVVLQKELRLAAEMDYMPWFSHAGAFALAAENDSFREIGAELLDGIIDYSVKAKRPELTAYFLELKKQKIGFTGDDLEL